MKISKVKITNLFGITNVELDGSPVELRGAKGTGKTSVLDAIKYALTNRSDRDYIVKNGEKEGEIIVETDTGLTIDRKKRTDKSDYAAVRQLGKDVQSPQTFLNAIFTPLQLDPVQFCTWDKATQNRKILDLIEFDWDMDWIRAQFGEIPTNIDYNQHILKVLDDIQSETGDYWKARAEANKKELYKRQQVQDMAIKFPGDYDADAWERYSLADKIRQLQTAQRENDTIGRAKQFLENVRDRMRGIDAEHDIAVAAEKTAIETEKRGLTATIERLKAEIAAAQDKLEGMDARIADKIALIDQTREAAISKFQGDMDKAREYAGRDVVDVTPMQKEIEHAEKMKTLISEYRSMETMKVECAELKERSAALTQKIELARRLPGMVLENAELPVKGLTVKDGVPLINGLPISNLSNGEKIDLCVDIAIAKTDSLQIVLIDGAEQLDDASRDALYQKCKDKGLQIIAARTTNNSEFTVVEL